MVENRLEAFSKNGFETVIYASRPTRGLSDKEYKEYKNKKIEKMYNGNIHVHRFPMYREGRNVLLRAVRYSLNWIIQLWYGMNEARVDCIYLESTPPIQGMLGSIIRIFRGIPLYTIFKISFLTQWLVRAWQEKGDLSGRLVV